MEEPPVLIERSQLSSNVCHPQNLLNKLKKFSQNLTGSRRRSGVESKIDRGGSSWWLPWPSGPPIDWPPPTSYRRSDPPDPGAAASDAPLRCSAFQPAHLQLRFQ